MVSVGFDPSTGLNDQNRTCRNRALSCVISDDFKIRWETANEKSADREAVDSMYCLGILCGKCNKLRFIE